MDSKEKSTPNPTSDQNPLWGHVLVIGFFGSIFAYSAWEQWRPKPDDGSYYGQPGTRTTAGAGEELMTCYYCNGTGDNPISAKYNPADKGYCRACHKRGKLTLAQYYAFQKSEYIDSIPTGQELSPGERAAAQRQHRPVGADSVRFDNAVHGRTQGYGSWPSGAVGP